MLASVGAWSRETYEVSRKQTKSKNINQLMHTDTVSLSINENTGLIKTPQNRFDSLFVT